MKNNNNNNSNNNVKKIKKCMKKKELIMGCISAVTLHSDFSDIKNWTDK